MMLMQRRRFVNVSLAADPDPDFVVDPSSLWTTRWRVGGEGSACLEYNPPEDYWTPVGLSFGVGQT